MPEPLIVCDNLVKIYKMADLEVVALQGLDLEVQAGEMLALVGASGSGKSTLMNILGGLDIPSAGKCIVAGHELTRLSEAQRIRYRRFEVGHVWQQTGRNLLPELSIGVNVEEPQMLRGVGLSARRKRANELLQLVGLAGKEKKRPEHLSGGEQQRAAIAVALSNQPRILLADEPTGELDSVTAGEVMHLLRTLNRQLSLTILIVTHDASVAAAVDRTIAIRDGRTSTETVRRAAPLAEVHAQVQTNSAVIGLSNQTHRESILIDRVGRLQLPKEALEVYPFHGRAEVRFADGHIQLWPANGASENNGNGANGNATETQTPAKQAGETA